MIAKLLSTQLRSFSARIYLRFAKTFPALHYLIIAPYRIRSKVKILANDSKIIYCVYDLDMMPITYNVFEYLAIFDVIARQSNKKFHLLIIKQRILNNVESGTFNKAHTAENRKFRISNILTFSVRLFDNCSGYSVLESEREMHLYRLMGEIFPPDYDPYRYNSNSLSVLDYKDYGVKFASIQVPRYSIKIASALLANQPLDRLVTITLRSSKYDTIRNSDLFEWSKFVDYMVSQQYLVVVIPDAENPLDHKPIEAKHIRTEFAFNLELRAALYQLARVNLGVANGPMIVSTMNKLCTTAILKVAPPGSEVGIKVYDQIGIDPNSPYFWYTDKHTQTTLYDSFDNIKYCFDQLIKQ
jgi:hypothetical protein